MIPPLDLGPLRLGEPAGLLALLVLVPAGWAVLRAARRRREADEAYGGPRALRRGAGATVRRLRDALLLGAVVALALALARPQWGQADQAVERRGIDVALVLDVSRSMTADDVAPTRAQAAAARLRELLTHLRGDRAGLVIFAGTAFERAPLTTDLDAIAELVQRAQNETLLVRPGSDPAVALATALRLLDVEDAAETQVVVLVSDGEAGEGSREDRLATVLDAAQRRGVRVYTVLAGSTQGGTLTDTPALQEVSRADPAALGAIAQATGGEFRELSAAPGLAVEFRRLGQTLFDEESERAPVDRFQWFAAAGLVLLVLMAAAGGRRGRLRLPRRLATPAVTLGGLFLAACAGTAVYQAVEEGNREFDAGRYEGALASYQEAADMAPEDPAVLYNISNALHALQRYEEAAVPAAAALALVEDPDLASRLQYTQGANAFHRGLMEEAREAYIEVLRRHPDDTDAKANLELVLRELAPPPPQPGPASEGEEGEEGEQGEGGEQSGGGNEGDPQPAPGGQPGGETGGEPGSQPEPGAPGQPGEQAGAGDTRSFEEAVAALEEALAEAGEEISPEEALRILELAREANALQPLRGDDLPGGTAPAR